MIDMIILYGLRDRDRYAKGSTFDCPQCGKRRYCTRRKIEAWFTLFLVPIFPHHIRAEYCKCDDCRHSFWLPDLDPFFPAGGYLPSDLRAELYAGAALEGVERRLVESGVDRETAAQVILRIVGERRNFCPDCELTYQEHVTACRKCDGPLRKLLPKKPYFDAVDGF